MSKSNRSERFQVLIACAVAFEIFMFCVLAYSMGESHTERQLRAQHNTQDYPVTTNERIDRVCVGNIGSALITCVQKEVEAAHDHRRSESDLSAQQDMSQWAYWLLWVSIGGIAVSTLALYLIWRTLKVTGDTLTATQNMATDTREIGEAQVRAYLSFQLEGTDFRAPILAPDDTTIPLPNIVVSLRGSIENKGQSPASEISILFRVGETYHGATVDLEEDGGLWVQKPIAHSIHAGDSLPDRKVSRTFHADIESLSASDKIIYFAVAMQWKDVFGSTIKSDPTFATVEFKANSDGVRKIYFGGVEGADSSQG